MMSRTFSRGRLNSKSSVYYIALAFYLLCVPTVQAQFLTSYGDTNSQSETALMPEVYVEPYSGDAVEIFSLDDDSSLNLSQNDSVEVFSLDDFAPISASIPSIKQATNTDKEKPTSDGDNDKSKGQPVDLAADSLTHDKQSGIVTARGDVVLKQAGRVLTADTVEYNLTDDQVRASGSVVMKDQTDDRHYADAVSLMNEQKDGSVDGLKTFLSDGSIFLAEEGERRGGSTTIMRGASYTPCRVCGDTDGQALERTPDWSINAAKVTHDKEERKISYNSAWFEAFGVPVFYTPYFSHPDGSITRKSGFLSPSFGFRSELGFFGESNYYWNIAPEMDATVGMMAMTEQAPMFLGQFRKRWENANLIFNGGVTYSDRTKIVNDRAVLADEEVRGHILANGLWDMNDKWRSGLNIEWASDDQYMRQYRFISKNILESQLYAERFSGRNYGVGRLLAFQDLRIRDEPIDQPELLPEIVANFKGDPNSVPILGGRWGVDGSFLGLHRDGADQDMIRASIAGDWMRHFVSYYGLVSDINSQARLDTYNIQDRTVSFTGSGQDNNTSDSRFYPSIHWESRYPLARQFKASQMLIEPTVSLTAAPNIDVNNNIPNEDSQDVQIDSQNLFQANRFPGLDRVEDQSRVSYGLRTGIYGYNGNHIDAFLGQSYRLDEDDNPFPNGSGLSEQSSDIVGQISSVLDQHNFNYRFQLNNETLSPERHELDATLNWNDKFRIGTQYLYARAIEGTEFTESREQLRANSAYYLTPSWRARASATQDLGEDSGLRRAGFGIDHYGQCVSWSIDAVRNLTNDASGESDTEILFRIGLKNLGEFAQSALRPTCTK